VERHRVYPFAALVGQKQLKKALILNAVNPAIGGVLIRGEKGTAKSTAVRGLASLLPQIRVVQGCAFSCDPDRPEEWCERCQSLAPDLPLVHRRIPVITLPLNATEDRVVGSIDLEYAIRTGERRFHPGVLAKAHRGILYIDEVNLLDDYIADLILDAAASGWNRVEREGISYSHPARFILVGTMNPEEGDLRPQLLDRFGLCVEVTSEQEIRDRVELMVRREAFDADPDGFLSRYERKNRELSLRIIAAKEFMPKVRMADGLRTFISELCAEDNVAGHRADIVMEQAARAVAALAGRSMVRIEDIQEVAPLVLIHRRREAAPPPPPPPQHENHDQSKSTEQPPEKSSQDHAPDTPDQEPRSQPEAASADSPDQDERGSEEKREQQGFRQVLERIFEIGQTFSVRKISAPKDRLLRKGSGRRSRTRTGQKQGRYVRSSLRGNKDDIALDATLRAAAPYQIRRKNPACLPTRQAAGKAGKNDLAVVLTSEDIRHKVRERRVGNFLLFVVDASGSMGAQGRMVATKGAIMSLLTDAYQKRDRVAMITFRKDDAELKLPPTSSVELGARLLRELPVGGRTPLPAALLKTHEVVRTIFLRDPTARPIVIIITDGKANVSLGHGRPMEESLLLAARLASDKRIFSLVVDTEKAGLIHFDLARRLAAAMDARYFRIEDLKADTLVHIIKEATL